MKLKNILEKIDVIYTNADLNSEICDICYDSRKAENNSLFVAVKGFETDGHLYINNAYSLGAKAVICEVKPDVDIPYVLVKDSRLALAQAAAAFYDYPADKMKMIGVTGTSGKTTTTQLIKHVLEDVVGVTVGLIGTNGNFIGDKEFHTEHTTPDSLDLQKILNEMYLAGCKYVVMEVSSHALSLNRIAGINFSVGAFTNLSQDHLDFHSDMDDYASAKKKLFDVCDKACINLDDHYSDFMLRDIPCSSFTYSINNESDLKAFNINLDSRFISFLVSYNNSNVSVRLNIPGKFSVYNALTVLSVCICLGLDISSVASSLATASGVKGRMESLITDGDYSIIIDYSHKPDALEKVIKTLKPVTRGRLITLFGCGGDRDKAKRPIMGKIAADYSDFFIVTSDNPRTEDPETIIDEIMAGCADTNTPHIRIADRIEAIHWAIDNVKDGDVILLAGKGHEDYQVIGHEKHHMDEREIVADYLKERVK